MSAAPEIVAQQPTVAEAAPVDNQVPPKVEDEKNIETPKTENDVKESAKELKPAKIMFRLDNGTIARFKGDSTTVELMDPMTAWKNGNLTEEHLLRLQSYLCEVHAKLPDEGPLKSVSVGSKRSIDTVLDVGQINSHMTTNKKAKPTGIVNHGSTPMTSPSDVTSRKNLDLATVARKLVNFLTTKVLKKAESQLFMDPVDASHLAVQDYYDVVPHGPISFNIIMGKIDSNEYSSPREFYDDVLKICDNCYQYNIVVHPVGWDVGLLGLKIEQGFLKAWARTPFASYSDPERKARPFPKKNPAAMQPVSRPAKSASMGRPASTKAQAPRVYMTPDMENDLVTALNTPEILEANMEAVVEILTVANEMGTDDDGEPSLDLEKVSAPTKRKLYDLVVKKPSNSAGARPTTSGFKMEDDDFEPDDEDM